ncbi:MAG: hypothetical protein O3B47_02850 [bacterium]|nr:hypothetical protein [bacterium]
MQHQCENCDQKFEISNDDERRYSDFRVPSPKLCHNCRQQRRVAHGNHLHLYKRKCDLTGKEIISNHSQDSPYKIYDIEIWHSDKWDPFEFGREYDFTRPFFEQFAELLKETPYPSVHRGYQYDENSDYTNYAGKNKNCYLIFDSDEDWDCYYCYSTNGSKNCMDCYRIRKCELCYECIDIVDCYNCQFVQDSSNCSDSIFLKNCIGCKKCIACSNLKNKEYYINNKKASKEEYESYLEKLKDPAFLKQSKTYFENFKLKFPQKFMHGVQNENVQGDYLTNCKNAIQCYDGAYLWDCKYVYQAFNPLKDCMDIQECGDAEQLYECAFSGYDIYNLKFCLHCFYNVSDLQYCNFCHHSRNCFGCSSLLRKEHCILNKQYSKEEYEKLLSRIIDHMKSTGEYGEFFPIELSLYPYNKTLAQTHYPLSKEQALEKGYKWADENEETSDTSLSETTLKCKNCSRNFLIIKQEAQLLKRFNIEKPEQCFYCRNQDRHKKRNTRRIHNRNCQKCQLEIKTTFAPEQKEIVYCEKCYLDSLL